MSFEVEERLDIIVDPSDQSSGPARWAIGLIAIMVLAAFVGVVWYIYGEGVDRRADVAPPLVKAPAGPAKVVPVEPGGLQVPDQDKQVFQAMQAIRSEPRTEQLLPPPEMPQPEAELEPAQPVQTTVATADPPAEEPTATARPSSDPPVPPQPAVTVAKADPPSAGSSQPSLASAQYLVQLAAFRDPTPADVVWGRLSRKYPNILGGMTHRLQMVDFGADKGVFHRLQVGGFATRSAAVDVCERLQARGQGCMVVRR